MIRHPPKSSLFPYPALFRSTISLWRLHVDGARLLLGVAQDVSLAREQWQMCLDTIHKSRSEEHTSELQSRQYLVFRLLLEKKKNSWFQTFECLTLADEQRET